MTTFDKMLNHTQMQKLGIVLSPAKEKALLDKLSLVLRGRLRRIVETRMGAGVFDQLVKMGERTTKEVVQAYLPDHRGILQTECLKLFQEVEEHAKDIQRGRWEAA